MNRCTRCKFKNSFFIKCKCDNEYCTKCLLPEKHNCKELHSFKKDAFEKNKNMINKLNEKKKEEWIIT